MPDLRDLFSRGRSVLTFVFFSGVFAIVSLINFPAAHLVVEGWIVLLMLAIYIFATRTFRLTADRYFLFLGSCLPGVVVVQLAHIMTYRGMGITGDVSGNASVCLWLAARFHYALIIFLAPLLTRFRVHRLVWSAMAVGFGTFLTIAVLGTDIFPTCFVEGQGVTPFKRTAEFVIAGMFVISAIWLLVRLGRRGDGSESASRAAYAKVMLASTGLAIAAELVLSSFRSMYGPEALVGHLLAVGSFYVILEGLVNRGLEVPIDMITRSRSQLEAAIGAAADGMLISSLSGSVIAMNVRFRIITGLGIDSVSGEDAENLLLRAARQALNPDHLGKRIRELMNAPDMEGFERFDTVDGRIFELFSIPYLFEGRIDGRVWSLRDVSVRERTTTQLERSGRRIDNILSAAGEGMFEADLDKGTLWFHPNWKRVVGYSQENVPQDWLEWKAVVHPEDFRAIQREFRRQQDGENEFRVDFRMKDGCGSWRWYMAVGRFDVIDSPSGEPKRILHGVQRDITDEKIREAEIRRQRGLMEALIENMPLGAFVKEFPSGRYVIWNSALARLSGLIPSQVIGRTDAELLGSDTARRMARSDEDVVNQCVTVVIENSWIGEAGGRNIRLRKVPVVDSDRSVRLIIGIVEDVTQQQQMERLIHRSRSMEALGRLAGGIAHDFNNILQVIIGSAEALKMTGHCRSGSAEDIDRILDAGDRAMALIRQLLTFSRHESAVRETIDVENLVSSLIRLLQRVIGADIQVDLRGSGALLPVFAEKSRLEQVVLNLTVNAVDAMPYGGTLYLKTAAFDVDESFAAARPEAAVGRYAMISVRDTGIGIPGDVLDHIYEPFFSTKEVGRGTGLGLSTVYGIVESLNGFMTVESESGKGTEFRVFLPMQSDQAGSGGPGTEDGADSWLVSPVPVILVAGDKPEVTARDAADLERAGFRVITAGSGPEALQRLQEADQEGGVDLMVLDLVMGGIGGRDIYDRYRQDHVEVPVVFCGTATSPMLEHEYVSQIPAEILRRPFNSRQLLLTVRTLMKNFRPV